MSSCTLASYGAGVVEHVVDEWRLKIESAADLETAAMELARRRAPASARLGETQLRSEGVTASLAGRHVFLREYLDGRPILNGGFAVTSNLDGTITSVHDRRSRARNASSTITADDARRTALGAGTDTVTRTVVEPTRLVGWIHEDGVARLAWHVVTRDGYDDWAILIDATSGEVIQIEPLFFSIDGRIFDPNPVTTLNQPALRDDDNSADAVPDSAYTIAQVLELQSEDRLVGPHVAITELEVPLTTRAKPVAGLLFDRSQPEFEEVMAYVHIDRSQRYIRSLGFTDAKAIVGYPLPVDAHGLGGEDNSYYRFSSPGRGRLVFGDGGVDDAEDADIILHEYGHAIQDSIVPAGFTGTAASQARAIGEGFGDYWAFSSSYAANLSSGADPFCVGNWDALCGDGPSSNCGYSADATCLRRVDGAKTMSDYIPSGGQGTEHRNGEIWSSALREIFMDTVTASSNDEGRRLTDRTILESHFGMPPNPSFRTAAIRLLDADRRLNSGLLEASICRAMTLRHILEDEDCDAGLRGDITLLQSPARGTKIPDNVPSGVTTSLTISDTRIVEAIFVAVDVRHPRRGDLRLTMTGPDGSAAVIQTESDDSAADIHATYGLDTQPSQPLTPFLGRSAAGTWTLNVADNRGVDEGELRGWSLLIRFAGDTPITDRGRPGAKRLHVAVTGTTDGAAGTKFVSDLRILNPGPSTTTALLFYTSSGENGLTAFQALSLSIPPGQIVALDDIVGSAFRSVGTGSIEVRGDPSLIVTSRIYNDQPQGTFGQFLAARASDTGVTTTDGPAHVVLLSNSEAFRANLGFAEIDGGSGDVEVSLFDEFGVLLSTTTQPISPYGHSQAPLFGGIGGVEVDAARAEVRVATGDAKIIVYGSSVDNVSGDAVLIPGMVLPREADVLVVPAAIHAEGAENTRWRSDLWLFNGGSAAVELELTWRPAPGGDSITRMIPLDSNELRRLDDVVSGIFETEGTGSIVISSDDLSSVIVASRAWNDAPSGSYGQFIEAVPSGNAIASAGMATAIHVDSDSTFRTNIGLTEVGGSPISARMVLSDASGNETFSTVVALGARENLQLNLAQLGAPPTRNARVRIEVLSGQGRVLVYASVIDNRTGDAIFIPAR